MRPLWSARLHLAVRSGLVGVVAACAASAPPAHPPVALPSTSASPVVDTEPDDDPMPALRTGAIAPIDEPGLHELTLVARHVANGYEILAAELPDDMESGTEAVTVDVGAGPAPMPFVARAPRSHDSSARSPSWVWIRRPVANADVTGDLFTAASGETPGRHYRFHIAAPGARPSEPSALVAWLDGLGEQFIGWRSATTPWTTSAYARIGRIVQALAGDKKSANNGAKRSAGGKGGGRPLFVRPRPVRARPGELSGFLETTTGLTAVQEALQSDRTLWYAAPQHQPTLPIASLQLPLLKHHPWAAMIARLDAAPPEPLAADVPAEFYYARAAGVTALLGMLDQVDTWGTAAGEILHGAAQERDLAQRYETQLALRRGPLTRALGPSVVGEMAIVGSDPYVEEGSDVTMLLRVKDRPLLDAALAATQAEFEKEHGSLAHETRDRGGISVRVSRSNDGAVRQQRATVGDVEIVSNSPAAMNAVVDACQGKRPRLADEPDFRFMLARDAREHADVLAFLGDAFVAQVVGPRQKVLERRREDALGELMQPGVSALLYGIIQGKSAYRVDDLLGAGLLAPDDLKHATGEPITWQVGTAPRSIWGTPAAMTPLIDLPAPDRVSPDEKTAYEAFARGYQQDWSSYIDPVAIRLVFSPAAGDAQTLTASMRELPLIDATKYSDFAEVVGAARFTGRPALGAGLRLVAGLAHDSGARKDLSQILRGLSQDKVGLDWIGDWGAVGLADRASIASAVLSLLGDKIPQKPGGETSSDLSVLSTLPLYAEVSVKSPAAAAIALAAARVLADSTIPGMFDWGEAGSYRDVPIVRIALKGDAAKELATKSGEVDVFYAMTSGALIVALQDWVLRRLIDERLDGRGPASSAANAHREPEAKQVSLEIVSQPGKGLWSVLAWGLEDELIDSSARESQNQAEGLLRGAPEIAGDPAAMRALAMAYFGAAPVTPDGAAYFLAKEGVRDPARGSMFAPSWPDIPVPGSPVDRVMRALADVRTQVSFDDEGKDGEARMRSLHAVASFDLRGAH